VRAGDEVLEINGKPPLDILDYLMAGASARMNLLVQRGAQRLRLAVHAGGEAQPGLDFEEDVFDGIRRCNNRCLFCFLAQNAPGMRRSLYVRDDDYRLSFLHGNFITLTNMRDEDFSRVRDLRLSPLYVSVHAVDPAVRSRLFGNSDASSIRSDLERLAGDGISLHTQIVLCPGINDGAELDRTLEYLASLHPYVLSIALVPVGLTRFHKGGLAPVTRRDAEEILAAAEKHRRRLMRDYGGNIIYLSDELYQILDRPFPPHASYNDYPQWENGVGMCRLFIREYRLRRRFMPRNLGVRRRIALVTGVSFARVLGPIVEELGSVDGLDLNLIAVKNRFYGESVKVAGLLTGEDIIDALRGTMADKVLVPSTCLRNGEAFLDGVTLHGMSREIGVQVMPVVPRGGAFLEALFPRSLQSHGAAGLRRKKAQ
jgi:putative radical SAM enzyme (TIGR03279 family)